MDKIYWGTIILITGSSVIIWAVGEIRDMSWRPKHYELYKEFKKIHDINSKEATRMYPARKNMSDRELEEIKDKQNEHTSSMNDIWYKHIQEKNKLTDKQLEKLKAEFNAGMRRGR